MALSPNDIRNYEFTQKMRGYDKEEVDSLLDQIALELEDIKQDNLKLSMEVDSYKSQLESLKQHENTIKQAAIDARQNADSLVSKAKAEAEEMLYNARTEAGKIINDTKDQLNSYKGQLVEVKAAKESFVAKVKDLIDEHQQLLAQAELNRSNFDIPEDMQMEEEERPSLAKNLNDSDKIAVTDSEERSREVMETLSSEPDEEQIITEEANAADDIIEVAEQPEQKAQEQTAQAEAPKQEEKKEVDSELAEALDNYQHLLDKNPAENKEVSPDTMIGKSSTPRPGEVYETNKRAEDIPDGFITPEEAAANQAKATDEVDTDRINLATENQPEKSSENLDLDTPIMSEKKAQVTPDNIASELDEVVAKFEETMDKAEKS